jgi:hypothetical protein
MYPLNETIDISYIERIYDDVLTFLKNVNRLKKVDDFFELLKYWNYWYEEEFIIFAKKVGGIDLSGYEWFAKTIIGKQIVRLQKSLDGLFYIDEKDFDKARNKVDMGWFVDSMDDFWRNLPVSITPMMIPNYVLKNPRSYVTNANKFSTEQKEILKEYYFQLWKTNAQSRYISTKKIVDEVFDEVLSNSSSEQMMTLDLVEDKYIDHYYDYEGVRIELTYNETEEKELQNKLSFVKSTIDICKKRSISFLLKDMFIHIDLVNDYHNYEFTLSSGKKTKNAGSYKQGSGEIIISRNADGEDILTVLFHEIGHKYYFEYLQEYQRKEWENYYIEIVKGGINEKDFEQELIGFNDEVSKLLGKIYDERRKARDELIDKKKVPSSWDFYFKITKNIDGFLTYIYTTYIDETNKYPLLKKFFNRLGIIDEYYTFIKKEVNKDLKKENELLYDIDSEEYKEMKVLSQSALISILDNLWDFVLKYSQLYKETSKIPSQYAGENEREFFAEVFSAIMIRRVNMANTRGFNYNEEIINTLKAITGLKESINKKYINVEGYMIDINKVRIEE